MQRQWLGWILCLVMFNHNLLYWVAHLLLLLLFFHFGRTYRRLRHIPGPKFAAGTDLWRLLAVRGGRAETTCLKLHKRYGDLVRIGANCVSISKPDVIQSTYGTGKGLVKASRGEKYSAEVANPKNSLISTWYGRTSSMAVALLQWSSRSTSHNMLP
jgi:hypothetical protein